MHGFSAVATKDVSERADIGTGTLFRYVASKNDLLLMVYNTRLREAICKGTERAASTNTITDNIFQRVLPLIDLSHTSIENSLAYQRELLFGSANGMHRQEGLSLIIDLEAKISDQLLQRTAQQGLELSPASAHLASSSIFAATHLIISRSSTGAFPTNNPKKDLFEQIQQIVSGYFYILKTSASTLEKEK